MSQCNECGKEYTPFVDGHITLCDNCYDEFLNGTNIQKEDHYKKVEPELYGFDKQSIDLESLKRLEKYHKSTRFHFKFYR